MPRKPQPPVERRFGLTQCSVEYRDAPDGATEKVPTFVGYAAVFNSLSNDLGGFRELVRDTCFDRSLAQKSDVRLLINHDSNLVLGRTRSGTLTLSKDETGIRVECPLPDTSAARDLQVSMDRGDIDNMSFGFRAKQDAWDQRDATSGLPIRELVDADLFDVSIVTFPAYPDTTGELREELQEFEVVPDEVRAAAESAAATLEPAETDPETEVRQAPVAQETITDLLEAVRQLTEITESRGKMLSDTHRETIGGAVSTIADAAQTLQDTLDSVEADAITDGAEMNNGSNPYDELRSALELEVPDDQLDRIIRHATDQALAQRAEARPNFIAYRRQLLAEGRDWSCDDDHQVYLLTQMISLGSNYMASEEGEDGATDDDAADDSADVMAMQGILTALAMLLGSEVNEPIVHTAAASPSSPVGMETHSDDPVASEDPLLEARKRKIALAELEIDLDLTQA